MFLFMITLDPQPWSNLPPPVIPHFTFPMSGSRPSLFRFNEPRRRPRRHGIRVHPLLQQVERTQSFQRDDQFSFSSAEEPSDGRQRKDECGSVQYKSGFRVRVFLRRGCWFPNIGFRCTLISSATSTVSSTTVASSSSPSPPASTTKCKVARYTILELFNLMREIRSTESFAEPRLAFCL